MDRMEEYKALRDAPEELPPALEGAVARARARARRRRLWRRISAPAGSAAAVFAAFVLLVNLSTPFALACGRVPVLKELAAAVAFSPSLKAAVENDYVQYIGQSATDNGITVHLEYLMADQGGLTLFLSITGPEEATSFMPRATFTTPNGERLENCSVQMDSVTPGALSNAITVAFKGEEEPQLPESLRLTCEVQAHIPDVTDAGEWTADAVVTFDLPLEQQFRGQGRTVEVNRWLELDGNNIRIVDLELYPTHARLNLEQDPDNAEELQSLDFYLEDKKGNRYEKGSASGLTAMGDSYLFESPYFSDPDSLTLHITKAEWLEKGREYLPIDLNTGEALAEPPEGAGVSARRDEDGSVAVAFYAPMPPGSDEYHLNFFQIGTTAYRTPDGTEHYFNNTSSYASDLLWWGTPDETPLPEGYFIEEYTIENYPWDTIDMGLYFTRRTAFGTPVTLALHTERGAGQWPAPLLLNYFSSSSSSSTASYTIRSQWHLRSSPRSLASLSRLAQSKTWFFSRNRRISAVASSAPLPASPNTISAPVTAPQVEPWRMPEPKLAPSLKAVSLSRPHKSAKGTKTDWQQL